MKTLSAIALLALLTTPSFAQENGLTPYQIGEIFCLGRLSNDMAPVLALTTPVLATAIAHAQALNAAAERAAPGDKPPLGDGLPWQNVSDYAAECTVGDYHSSATMSGIDIHYGFPEAPEVNYTDTLVLIPIPVEPGYEPFLRIDDIAYGAGGSLQTALVTVFEP